nr:polyketide synthase [Polyangiaceae bacterium]
MKIKKFLLDQIRTGNLSEEESGAMLRELLALEVDKSGRGAVDTVSHAPIAITGYSCKLPSAENPEAFWNVVRAGQSNVRTFPPSRLLDFARTKRSIYEEYAPNIEALQTSKLLEGGFFERVDTFDPRFFGLSPAEAKVMGPPERFFLETSWAALSHAGYTRDDLAGSNTATYCAYTPDVPAEYRKILQDDEPQAALYNNPGAIGYHLAHWLDLRGATMIVETTCSSSLSAIHLALRALRSGECDRAIVTGISMYLFPLFRDLTDRVGVTSPTGRCRPFDAEANGFVLGEGAVSFVLRRLDDAVAHHDAVHAVVRGSAINTNGRTSNLMAPSPARQTELIVRAWKDAGLENVTPDYVETHGAGTKLGDPVELQAIGEALSPDLPEPCVIGAVKGNVGHLFDASGAVSLLKVVLSLKHHWIPGIAGLSEPSSLLPLQRGNLSLSTGAGKAWNNGRVRRAGVMSLGINGTNAHVLVESPAVGEGTREGSRPFEVCCLSALGLGALWRMIDALATSLEETDATLKDVCWTLARRRDTFPFRLS